MPSSREISPVSVSDPILGVPSTHIPGGKESCWQHSLQTATRDLPALLERLNLSQELLPENDEWKTFPLLVPDSYLARMRCGDATDPLLLQVLPQTGEAQPAPGFLSDPVGDSNARLAPGLLQKYHGRALLIAHGSCAVHCRYCFRREYPYDEDARARDNWEPALQAVRRDESIHEVILSGGDPLLLSDRRLQQLIERLETIPHLRRLRIHSRLPVVLPDRVTSELIEILRGTRFQAWMVLHANHANELVDDCADAINRLVRAGIPTMNQAVLLRCVNNSVDALAALCERCVDLGVLPYYLHQLDRVRGAAHFEVPVETGRRLIEEVRQRLPGYAVPKYVVEIAGESGKRPL